MAIQNQAFAIVAGLDNFNFLVFGLLGSVNFGDSPHVGFIRSVKLDMPMRAYNIGHKDLFSIQLVGDN
jgi:hypothetical protein